MDQSVVSHGFLGLLESYEINAELFSNMFADVFDVFSCLFQCLLCCNFACFYKDRFKNTKEGVDPWFEYGY